MPLPHLGTMNGSGTRLLGVRPCGDGTFHATAWKVWSNMPIRPLSRHRLRMLGARQNNLGTLLRRERSIELLEDTPLEPREVRRTRLQHWLVAPLVLLLPLLLCLPLWSWIGGIAVGMGQEGQRGPRGRHHHRVPVAVAGRPDLGHPARPPPRPAGADRLSVTRRW